MRNIFQSKVNQSSIKYFILASSLVILAFTACDTSTASTEQSEATPEKPAVTEGYGQLTGEEKALEQVEKMLTALGGREKWQSIKSINYREKRDQKGIDTTYTLEMWIDLEGYNSKTEQKGTKFHSFVSIRDTLGKVYDVKTNRSVDIRPNDMQRFRYQYTHDMYRLIKQLAIGDALFVKMRNPNRFDIMNGDILLGGFNLDAQDLPEYFGSQMYKSGKNERIIHFTGWKKEDGVAHPVDGETIDGNMTFIMDTWTAYTQPIDELFPDLETTKTQ